MSSGGFAQNITLIPGVNITIMSPSHGLASSNSLIKAVRSLDQSSAESVPETLLNLWTLLTSSSPGSFHAAEGLVLRWLLKNMNGTAEAAEKFRRYSMSWNVMACVFTRIPLISLAKSLADRRFIPILQQTLKELSKPANPSSDVEMADAGSTGPGKSSKKRKRSAAASFDVNALRSPHGSLETANSLFCALKALLARLDPLEADAPSNVLMGAEHVKSLFYSPAKEAVELLRPILTIYDLALQEQEGEPFEDQASWASVLTSLWNLHLQSSGDAAEVAVSLYPTGCIVLAKMDRSKDLTLDPHVKAMWTRHLRRFFIKAMILPARAAFLNRKDIGIIKSAVDVTDFMPTASNPLLFSLAVKAPHSTEDAGARKNHEDWTQRVFDVIEEPMREADPVKRNQAMKVVLDTALDSTCSVALGRLRMVCKTYRNLSDKMDLDIVTRVANLDVDAFLISNEGHGLLDDVLQQVTDLSNAELQGLAEGQPVDLIVSLAKGFAKGRDLPGFIKKWFVALTECLKKGADYSAIAEMWSCTAVTETVSSLLQASVNTRQLLTLLEWLDSQEATSKAGALLVILDAASQGITDEDFIDAANLRIYEMISGLKLKSLEDSARARWWHIVESVVSHSTLDQSTSLWTKVEPDLKKVLKKGDPNDATTSAAFNCSTRFWLANYQGGSHETEVAVLTCSFLKRLEKHGRRTHAEDGNDALRFFDQPRLIDMFLKSEPGKEYLQTVLDRLGTSDVTSTRIRQTAYNEASLNNYKYINGLVVHAIEILAQEQTRGSAWEAGRVTTAARILLDLPSEAITREHREQIMPKALFFTSSLPQNMTENVGAVEMLLALMAKVTKRPTFYETMMFADLVTIGDSIVSSLQASLGGDNAPSLLSTYGMLKLFEALATNTMKQMTLNLENREQVYLTEATATVAGWPANTTELQPQRLILLRSLIIALESSNLTQQARAIADPAALKECASLMFAHNLESELLVGATNEVDGLKVGLPTWYALISYDQIDVIEPSIIRNKLEAARSDLERSARLLCSKGWRTGWQVRELIFTCFGDAVAEPLHIEANDILSCSNTEESVPPLCMRADASHINRYFDVVIQSMSLEMRDGYFGSVAARLREDGDVTGHLLALNRLLCAENDPTLRSCVDKLDLAKVHSVLSDRLVRSQSSSEFFLVAQTIHRLLDNKASCMKQWNTEVTLSTVSIIAARGPDTASRDIQASPHTYEWLCRLVEVIIKRHRLRLEGHFHLLTTALQALLRRLIVGPAVAAAAAAAAVPLAKQQAKSFARLVTLVCEPSVASVTRGQQPGALDSAVDAAKRSAGQHMYLVLMSYIKLQLDHAVPRAVREALEAAVYAVLDITSPGGRRILNEAVDGSGRAIFRDMYRRYVKFGKWSGV
ncbi:unnamed protein product [Discula destructiva]